MRSRKALFFVFILIFGFNLSGCNMPMEKITTPVPPTEKPIPPTVPPTMPPDPTAMPTITAVPEIVHKDLPGSPIGASNQFQTIYDQTNEKTAAQKQAFGGDDFKNGKYERPFDQSMNYLPLTDLKQLQLNRADPLWIYVLFTVNQPFTSNPSANSSFLVEIDTDLDNRGDLLIVTGMPKDTKWSTESVLVLTDPDLNVGGQVVVKPDPVLSEGRGYFEEIFNNGVGNDPDLAWSRLSKVDPAVVEIAFKNKLTGGEMGKFIWLPWTDSGMLDWSLFDFNDHFTLEQAGFPLKEDTKNYPLKALWGVDNTCRMPSGFKPTGFMPGLCPNSDPPPSKGPSKSDCVPICYNLGKETICSCP
jgi:hypothetical protein